MVLNSEINQYRLHFFLLQLVDKDLDEYLDDMSKPKTYGTLVELQAVGYMFQYVLLSFVQKKLNNEFVFCCVFFFRRNVLLFQPFDLGNHFNNRNCFNEVFRVFYTPERHFDSVFTCDYIKDAAICQCI